MAPRATSHKSPAALSNPQACGRRVLGVARPSGTPSWTRRPRAPMIGDAMSSPSQTRRLDRPGTTRPTATHGGPRAGPAVVLALVVVVPILGCRGETSLDQIDAAIATEATGAATTGGTLPALDDGDSSTGEASTGQPPAPDDPRLCPAECTLELPLDWAYDGTATAVPSDPGTHRLTAMLREPNGMLTLGEQRDGTATLHRIDRHGALQWNVPLLLPCDVCDLSHVARHPSGDLLLSASGWLVDADFTLLASRYDPVQHTVVWVTTRPLQPIPGVQVRSGDIAALDDGLVTQLYMSGQYDFDVLQNTRLVVYDDSGLIVAEEHITQGSATIARPPLLGRATADQTLVIGVFGGFDGNLYGRTDRIAPPLWNTTAYVSLPFPLDDLAVDDRGHSLDVGHTFDGTRTYLVLADRSAVSTQPSWVATLGIASTTSSPAALALGPEGELYLAVRTTQAPSDDATPLVGLALTRWTSGGELRWSSTLLMGVDDTHRPVTLAVDDDEGLVIAAIVGDRLRVERRTQHCECG